jgi:hypothetical protein
MFSLLQQDLPRNARELAAALDAGLRRLLEIPSDPVVVREKGYPDLDEIAVDLSGARMRANAPRPSFPAGEGDPALTARHLMVTAHPLSFGNAAVDLDLEAIEVVLHQNRGADDNILLLLHRTEAGHIAISISQHNLETLVAEIAKGEAGKHGVVIEDVLLNLTSRGPRSLGADLRVQARKLFVRATIRIAGRLEIDDRLVARISRVSCEGEGAIGALVCGILTPHLQKVQTHAIPLLALPLGEVRLRDIRLNTGDGIKVTAEFGPAASTATT